MRLDVGASVAVRLRSGSFVEGKILSVALNLKNEMVIKVESKDVDQPFWISAEEVFGIG